MRRTDGRTEQTGRTGEAGQTGAGIGGQAAAETFEDIGMQTTASHAAQTAQTPSDELIGQLAADLTVILGRPVHPKDFRARRDGALPRLIGALAVAAPRSRRTASRLLAEWIRAGSIQQEPSPETAGPLEFDVPSLLVGGTPVPGLRMIPPPPGLPPQDALERLLPAAAALAGTLAEVIEVGQGRTDRSPGWAARLRLLARIDELGHPGHDQGEWVVNAHEAIASLHVPEAEPGSVWTSLIDAARAHADAALKALGENVDADLLRRDDAFAEIVDMQRSAVLDGHPVPGKVLQVVRLPRRRGDRTWRGAVLFGAGGVS
ncbi:hypothetical protein AB0K60_01660 [Thermopolyspora sp. NPDC052614]|uniref:hypothetical protein n=1 Tax=Thermopolyspora sp. NPDC052614 TaxID=3155682 RepID=UPI00343078C3